MPTVRPTGPLSGMYTNIKILAELVPVTLFDGYVRMCTCNGRLCDSVGSCVVTCWVSAACQTL